MTAKPVSAKTLHLRLIKRGAKAHLLDIAEVQSALDWAKQCAEHAAKTGRIHRDEYAAHEQLKKAFERLMI